MMFDVMPTINEDRVSNIGADMTEEEDEVVAVILEYFVWYIDNGFKFKIFRYVN